MEKGWVWSNLIRASQHSELSDTVSRIGGWFGSSFWKQEPLERAGSVVLVIIMGHGPGMQVAQSIPQVRVFRAQDSHKILSELPQGFCMAFFY